MGMAPSPAGGGGGGGGHACCKAHTCTAGVWKARTTRQDARNQDAIAIPASAWACACTKPRHQPYATTELEITVLCRRPPKRKDGARQYAC